MNDVKAQRTHDVGLIREVASCPEIAAAICEDGVAIEDMRVDTTVECWLAMILGEMPIGVYNLHVCNGTTLEIHAHVLPEYREEHSYDTGLAALQWILDNAPEYQKVIAQVPEIYENVKRFTCSLGFQVEGTNRKSYQKNGEIVDQWLLGITKTEIEEFLRCPRP